MGVRERLKKETGMVTLFKQGKTLEEIGQVYGVTKQWVSKVIKKHNLTRKDGGKSLVVSNRPTKKKYYVSAKKIDELTRTIEQQQEEIERLLEIRKQKNNGITELTIENHELKKEIERHKEAVEQSLRSFDRGDRLNGLLILKETLEGSPHA